MIQLIGSSRITIVVGLGLTGLSVVRYLQKQQRPFMVVDSRNNPPMLDRFNNEFPGIAIETGALNPETLSEAAELIVSPGVSLQEPAIQTAVQKGVSVIGDIELFARASKAPIVAITGSNAKSTVTTLVGEMASEAGFTVGVGGNIGTPALTLLEKVPNADVYVLELSSFQLETTQRLNAQVATILNISPDHMDRYPNMMAYMNAKLRVFFGAQKAVVNRDDPLAQAPLAEGVKSIGFTARKPDLADFGLIVKDGETWLAKGLQPLIPVSQMAMRGAHNYTNALSALALGEAVNIPMAAMLRVLRYFRGLAHRCEYVASINGVDFINDSKATNIGALEAALNGFHCQGEFKKIILIAGGVAKGIDLSPLAQQLVQTVKVVFLMGADAKRIAEQWKKAWDTQMSPQSVAHPQINGRVQANVPSIIFVDGLESAVEQSLEWSERDDIVLLSPACASQDMFKNYQERGDQFKKAVMSLVTLKARQ